MTTACNPIHRDGFNRMEAFQRLPVPSRKRHVSTDISGRASRFETAQYVTLCQLLVFDADDRVCENGPAPRGLLLPAAEVAGLLFP
jgi:hypothetical protein